MENSVFNSEKIISRLQVFNYDYHLKGTTLKIYLPMMCYLKIDHVADKVKITSRISFGFRFLPIEINFVIYGLFLYCLTWFQWPVLNKGIFALLGIMLIHFVVCFIKIESMKTIVHNWIEKDSQI
jgi:hypothetical protein